VIRLVVPVAASVAFFLLSLATVRIVCPKEPRKFFLLYGLVLLGVSAWVLSARWPARTLDDALAMAACLVLQAVGFLTMWNAFYSLLWGFSGTLMYELYTDPALRDRERLIRSYEGDGEIDRMMARRLPNLVRGGWVSADRSTLRLRPKGRLIALGTLVSFKVFSLGMGGGVK
jgi:hypothetical protein